MICHSQNTRTLVADTRESVDRGGCVGTVNTPSRDDSVEGGVTASSGATQFVGGRGKLTTPCDPIKTKSDTTCHDDTSKDLSTKILYTPPRVRVLS